MPYVGVKQELCVLSFLLLILGHDMQVTILAAGKGVRSVVLRLPMYVWGNGGSFFIPINIAAAKEHGKAHYILPGRCAALLPFVDWCAAYMACMICADGVCRLLVKG